MEKMRTLAIFTILSLMVTGAAFAGIPSASTSTVEREGQGTPDCNPDAAVVCPLSDAGLVYVTVTVRNVYGDPLPGKIVDCYSIVVSGGPFCFCPGEDPQQSTTDVNGQAFFSFTDFGGCGDLQFGAECEGVVFTPSPSIFVLSPDGNGDCVVNLTDFIAFAGVYNTVFPCFDFNCDGIVNLTDFIFFAGHYNHACP
jgi:hypothetical protein